jgi:type II secretory pathway pseudopilin PulG
MRCERGITIIETTVILSVLFILAGAMSPIVSESVSTARAVKAKNDASMIAMGLINFQKDLGADALSFGGTGIVQSISLPEVLASDGTAPAPSNGEEDSTQLEEALPLLVKPGEGLTRANRQNARGALRALRRRWQEASRGSLDDHLTTNRRGYRYRRSGEHGGWAGPYVNADIKGDPWGNQYLINTQFLDGGTGAADGPGRVRRAVFVVSAGANGSIETPYEQPVTEARAFGDDIVLRLQ